MEDYDYTQDKEEELVTDEDRARYWRELRELEAEADQQHQAYLDAHPLVDPGIDEMPF